MIRWRLTTIFSIEEIRVGLGVLKEARAGQLEIDHLLLTQPSDDVNALLCELSDDGQSAHSGWIANWVEYVAFAAVPLENIPLYIMQLGNCLGIDLLR